MPRVSIVSDGELFINRESTFPMAEYNAHSRARDKRRPKRASITRASFAGRARRYNSIKFASDIGCCAFIPLSRGKGEKHARARRQISLRVSVRAFFFSFALYAIADVTRHSRQKFVRG